MGEAGHALYSTVIDAPLCKVWAHLRAFDKAPGIGSVIPGSVVNVNGKGSAELGVVRQINFGDQHVVETLVTLSDDEHVIAYVINSSSEKAFPGVVNNYKAKLQFYPVISSNQTFVRYEANWTGTNIDATVAVVTSIFTTILSQTEKELKQ